MSCSVRSVLVGIVCIVSSWASVAGAVSVSGITYLPTDDGEVFQVPSNVLDVASLRNTPSGMSTAAGARGNLSARDLAQTFTVSSTDFPTGVDVAGFGIFYESLLAETTSPIFVELFPVNDPIAGTLASSATVAGSLLITSTALTFESASTLHGTAIFNFSSALHLDPGSYAWRFRVPDGVTSNLFAWGPTSSSNDYGAGRKYEGDADAGTQTGGSGDFNFFFIQIPEPMSCYMFGLGLIGISVLRMSRRK